MELKDGFELIKSENYRDRFKGEYMELYIRHEKLSNMLEKWRNNELGFLPDTPYDLLAKQLDVMEEYLNILKERAIIESIDLD